MPPAGYQPTVQNAGDDANDSDADPATGQSQIVSVPAGQYNLTIDAGYWRPASLGNYVWEDYNRNGVQDEPQNAGLNGVTVTLMCLSGTTYVPYPFGPNVLLTGNDPSGRPGYYTFTNLISGTYAVSFTQLANYSFSPNTGDVNQPGNSDANPVAGLSAPVVLNAGDNNPNVDAGVWRPSGLGDYVWEDVNHNGVQDAGEPPISGVMVSLRTPTTTLTTTTSITGYYAFTGLLPLTAYTVTFSAPAGYVWTEQVGGMNTPDNSDVDVNGRVTGIVLGPGEHNPNVDVGVWASAFVAT